MKLILKILAGTFGIALLIMSISSLILTISEGGTWSYMLGRLFFVALIGRISYSLLKYAAKKNNKQLNSIDKFSKENV